MPIPFLQFDQLGSAALYRSPGKRSLDEREIFDARITGIGGKEFVTVPLKHRRS